MVVAGLENVRLMPMLPGTMHALLTLSCRADNYCRTSRHYDALGLMRSLPSTEVRIDWQWTMPPSRSSMQRTDQAVSGLLWTQKTTRRAIYGPNALVKHAE